MTKKKSTKEGVEAINTCIQFAYNTDGEEFARMIYGRAFDNGYVKEKFATMRSDFARYWGSLDTSNRHRFMDAATARAEAQAIPEDREIAEALKELDDMNREQLTRVSAATCGFNPLPGEGSDVIRTHIREWSEREDGRDVDVAGAVLEVKS